MIQKDLSKAVMDCLGINPSIDYISALEKIYADGEKLLKLIGVAKKIKLSSGVSNEYAPKIYTELIAKTITDHANYRNYAPPQGDVMARKSIASKESIDLDPGLAFTYEDVCITDGATGAISSIFEYLAKAFSNANVVIPCPNYYIFKLCAKNLNINYKEVPLNFSPKDKECLSPIKEIIKTIDDTTKLVVITSPGNPTGEVYSLHDIQDLILTCKRTGAYILFDEVFKELTYSAADIKNYQKLAQDLKYLDKCIFVNGLSKSKNLPGLRIGYVCSKDKNVTEYVTKAQEIRSFNASASNFKELIILDSFFNESLGISRNQHTSVEQAAQFVSKKYTKLHIALPFSTERLIEELRVYIEYMDKLTQSYQSNHKAISSILSSHIDWQPNNKAAFNTFIKINKLNNMKAFDFSLNLFLFYGVKTQLGPYFGFTARDWQETYGFWMRVSYSMDHSEMITAAHLLNTFIEEYTKNPERFIHTNKRIE